MDGPGQVEDYQDQPEYDDYQDQPDYDDYQDQLGEEDYNNKDYINDDRYDPKAILAKLTRRSSQIMMIMPDNDDNAR